MTGTIDTICQQLSTSDRELFLVFDRDGTLVPFTANPADATLDFRVRDSLNRLADLPGIHVAILSARSICKLDEDLPDRKQILAGNYGLEIEFPTGARFIHPQAQSARINLEKARDLLEKRLMPQFECILEDHGLSLCLHFHKTPESLQEEFHTKVRELAADFPELYFKLLATSYEVWPAIDWDKSHGLDKMLELAKLSPDEIILLYAGDSIVDEPAFDWVNLNNGISILVGKRNSKARFSLDTPSRLHELIGRLEWMTAAVRASKSAPQANE